MNYLRLQPFKIGTLLEKDCNGIYWTVTLNRNITNAEVNCSLIYVDADGGTKDLGKTFTMIIPNEILQNWGADDSIIDDFVCTYSPLFIKDTSFNKS
jgi:hypothetical protein